MRRRARLLRSHFYPLTLPDSFPVRASDPGQERYSPSVAAGGAGGRRDDRSKRDHYRDQRERQRRRLLRQAVMDASPGDTINFTGTFPQVTLVVELLINKGLTIAGPGANKLWVQHSSSGPRVVRIPTHSSARSRFPD